MRKYLILTHRYLGIALSVIFVSWFASGIAMLYGRGMPRLTPDMRLERIAPIDATAVKLSASEALERAELDGSDRATLLTIMGRPAYRFGGGGESTTAICSSTSMPHRHRRSRPRSFAFPRIACTTLAGSSSPISGR